MARYKSDEEVLTRLSYFLKDREVYAYYDREDKGVIPYIELYFWDIEEFTEAIGEYYFEEGGIKVTLFDCCIRVELIDILISLGKDFRYLKDYYGKDTLNNIKIWSSWDIEQNEDK